MVRLLTQFFEPKQTAQANISGNANDNPEKIVAEIINDLQQINHQKNSQLILVYLPTWGDYDPAQAVDTETWRTYIGRLAKERNIVFLDLVAEFRQVPQDQLYMLFLHENEVDFPGAAGHYSVRGNEFVAQHLFNKLTALENLTAPD
jgi:Cdc6-like AAA superfamily ATPase